MDFSSYHNKIEILSRQINESQQELVLPYLSNYDLTFLQFQLLRQVQQVRQITVGKLAKVMALDAGNVSAYCKKLEKMALLMKVRSSDDERVVQLALTDKSKQIITIIDSLLLQRCKNAWEALSQDEIDCVMRGMELLNQFFNTILKEGAVNE